MATDGPKIIDGDLAHDTYWGIMDMYDSGINPTIIAQEFPLEDSCKYCDEFEFEIYVTALALAFWEIGLINQQIIDLVAQVIEKGEGVRVWTEETDSKTGKKRQQELNRLWKKISQPNPKIRKQKKYREVTNFHFQPDEVLAFQLKDGSYRAVICAKVTQYRGQCTYDLVATTYSGLVKPSVQDILEQQIVGHWIHTSTSLGPVEMQQPGVELLWEHNPRQKNKIWGFAYRLVTHPDFYAFKDKFEKVGSLKIAQSFLKHGGYGYESTFERFEEIFEDLDKQMKAFGQTTVPIKAVLAENKNKLLPTIE